MSKKYSITIHYNTDYPVWKKESESIFSKCMEKGLNFLAMPSKGKDSHNAVRVFIKDGNIETGYNPLTDYNDLEKVLNKLK